MKIYTIIVTYNALRNNWIQNCLDSLYSSTVQSEIIIVDNNSTDETCNYLKKRFPQIVLLENKQNEGFGQANNRGISWALKNDADFVFLLNQDAVVAENTIEKLVTASRNNPDFAILSPIHYNYEGTELEYYFADFMQIGKTPLFFANHIKGTPQEIYDTQFVNAAAWLIPCKIFNTVGGFDPIFFHYGEDNNFCHRILFHGYRIGIVSGSFINHDSSIRKQPADYQFSDKYFSDVEKGLKIKYGNINIQFENLVKTERNILLSKILFSVASLRLKDVPQFFKEFSIIKKTIKEVEKSRENNKVKGSHYLNL